MGLAREAVADADAILITAGAGMGVDSGLPDFRGNEGFWEAYPPMKGLGISFFEMANPSWFERDPTLAWGFYGHRLNLYRNTEPHEGFEILRTWGQEKPGGFFVFTSNVDGQFQRALFPEDRILECHGSINHLQCASPCTDDIWSAQDQDVAVDDQTFRAQQPLPSCPRCGGLARPNVLMFGDWSWISHRSHEQESRFAAWLQSIVGQKLVVVELGAGTAVPTVRMTSEQTVQRNSGALIRINMREPQVPHDQIGIAGGALETLRSLVERE